MIKSALYALPFIILANTAMADPFNMEGTTTIGTGHVQAQILGQTTRTTDEWSGNYSTLKATYGITSNLDVFASAPLTYSKFDNQSSVNTFGDVQIGAKYRVLEVGPYSVAVKPSVYAPVINDSARVELPVYATYTGKDWSVSAGGGYTVNFNTVGTNTQFVGLLGTYNVSDNLKVGTEVYHTFQTVEDTTVGLGATYNVNARSALLAYVSTGVQNEQTNNEFTARLGYRYTY